MVNPGPDQPSHGHEYPPLEQTPPEQYAVDYPTNTGPPPQAYPPPYPGANPDAFAGPAPGAYPGAYDAQPNQYPYPPPPAGGFPPGGYPPAAPYQQYPGGYPGYDPYRPQQPSGTNGKAIASLVTSLAGLVLCGLPSIVGLILGIIAMRETKQTGQEGHGMALAGVIVGGLAVAGWLVYIVIIVFAIAVTSSTPYGY